LKEVNPLDVVRVYFEFRNNAEIQISERERIWAERDKALAAIEAERELILVYFSQRFEERKAALEQLFRLLNEGSNSKDAAKIDIALEGILGVVRDSPLKDFDSFGTTRREGRIIDI
jgi:hypothetical protein